MTAFGATVPPVQYTWIAGPSDKRRYTWIAFRRTVMLRQFVILSSVPLAVIVLDLFSDRTSIVVPVAVFVALLLPVGTWIRIHRTLGKSMFPGARWSTGFNEYGILLANPGGTVVFNWDTVTSVAPRLGLVVFKTRGSRNGGFGVPDALCPVPALDYATRQIGSRKS